VGWERHQWQYCIRGDLSVRFIYKWQDGRGKETYIKKDILKKFYSKHLTRSIDTLAKNAIMKEINLTLDNLDEVFPDDFSEAQKAKAKTLFLKRLAEKAHCFYSGKIQTVPKAPVIGFNWFNVWYTPGVSKVSTSIRDDNSESFNLSNRGNLVAVVSDSTRVLGDGDVTPSGGLGVMEGKAFLMKYLGGVDGVALCVDSTNKEGKKDPDKIIEFVKMLQPSFGAVNLEDISQPNCYKVLDVLREECDIPVWHDDQQGTATVTLAGLINALKVVGKKMEDVNIAFIGSGASNVAISRLIFGWGADPGRCLMVDSKGILGKHRDDLEKKKDQFVDKWRLCQITNEEGREGNIPEAMKEADVVIALSRSGPGVIEPEWVSQMADDAIVFACANPVPEIWPWEAKEAGAAIVATGRSDFDNQVNNSLGFPGIFRGALDVRSRTITDEMCYAAAEALANHVGDILSATQILPTMDDWEVFPREAAAVAMIAQEQNLARIDMAYEEEFEQARQIIERSRNLTKTMMELEFIEKIIEEE